MQPNRASVSFPAEEPPLTDEQGVSRGERKYHPFGHEVEGSDGETRMRFTGHERDDGVGLDYMRARYYAPAMGRFLGVDPVLGETEDPASWNRRPYVRNRTTTLVDLDGRSIWKRAFKVGYAVGKHLTVVARVKQKSRGKALGQVRQHLHDLPDGRARVVTTESDRQSRKLAQALDPEGRVRPAQGLDQSPGYPAGVHPNSGPYSDVHIQTDAAEFATPGYHVSSAAGVGGLLSTITAILAPASTMLNDDPQATTTEVVSAAVWDVTSTLDPTGLTDLLNSLLGIEE